MQNTGGTSRVGRGVGAVTVALLLAVGVLLMHGVTDRWTPALAGPSHPLADAADAGSSEGEHDVLGHHDLERCVACGLIVGLTIGLLVTAFHAPSRKDLVGKASERVIALDLSPPGPTELCVALC